MPMNELQTMVNIWSSVALDDMAYCSKWKTELNNNSVWLFHHASAAVLPASARNRAVRSLHWWDDCCILPAFPRCRLVAIQHITANFYFSLSLLWQWYSKLATTALCSQRRIIIWVQLLSRPLSSQFRRP